jgi:ubiquinone/menaquinone biosynthesis C-methylase UbiE
MLMHERSHSHLAAEYAGKSTVYYGNARKDYVALLPSDPSASILELGCGNGATGALALHEKKCSRYVGIEMFEPMARMAEEVLTKVHQGNVESMSLPYPAQSFDVLILSEVLEHLVDPETTLRSLTRLLKVGGRVFASSPNVAHYKIIRNLLLGRFDYLESGPMDKTHLRWFTPRSFARMFEQADIVVDHLAPHPVPSVKRALAMSLVGPRLSHIFWSQINLHGHRNGT